MAKSRYYTPRLDRDLVTQLFHAAKSRRLPMTRLASRLVREGLARLRGGADELTAIVREDAPAPDPSRR
jgi:hypothetical protein